MSKKEKKYPMLCSWCWEEGTRTVVGWSTVKGSHGICPAHKDAMLRRQQERRRRPR